ncbi:DUF3885 domain-containing protein [Streptosporangium sp. KLBMP 9127]|nr:hypothetical protein [Streptosporangium sp. KLBMP 9127]
MADQLKHVYPDRWVRFHSLPGSKRYADDESEYAILLRRHNTVLDELFTRQRVYIVTATYGAGEDDYLQKLNPGSRFWTTLRDEDPDTDRTVDLHVGERPWRPGMTDPLLRAVADDEHRNVIIMDTALHRLYHPYDGGADCLVESTEARDRLKEAHSGWLSRHSGGF